MKFLKLLAVLFFDLIDKYIHQKNIIRALKGIKYYIEIYVDIGAHKGTYIDVFRKSYDLKKIYAFEPQPEIYKNLKAKYRKLSYVKCYQEAASNSNGYKFLNLNVHDLTSSFTKPNENNFYLKLKSKLFQTNIKNIFYKNIRVKVTRLSSFLKKKKIKEIDLLKIDSEGHEFQVLQGIGKDISKVSIILIEFHKPNIYLGYNSNKIHNHLIKNDFFLEKKIKFPLTTFEDRIYINRNILKNL